MCALDVDNLDNELTHTAQHQLDALELAIPLT